MVIILVIFALAAIGGVVLATLSFKGKKSPMPLAIGHGLLGALGLILLLLVVLKGANGGGSLAALIVFSIAAVGGFILFAKHLKGEAHPKRVVILHGLAAGIGFVILLLSMW